MKKKRIRHLGQEDQDAADPGDGAIGSPDPARSPGGSEFFTQEPKAATWWSIQFIGYSARVKMLKKRSVMTPEEEPAQDGMVGDGVDAIARAGTGRCPQERPPRPAARWRRSATGRGSQPNRCLPFSQRACQVRRISPVRCPRGVEPLTGRHPDRSGAEKRFGPGAQGRPCRLRR